MGTKVHLEGRHLIVRDWHLDEVDGMHRWYGDPTVRKFLSFGADSIEESSFYFVRPDGRPVERECPVESDACSAAGDSSSAGGAPSSAEVREPTGVYLVT